ncbi:hypothetical protein AAKU55_005419 [Oxalobacteraceae bacterium GrIS 1.11]
MSTSLASKPAKSNRRLTIEQMRKIALDRGGACLSSVYVNTDVALIWQCAQQHQWVATPNSVKRGSWCRLCAIEGKRLALESMRALAHRLGGTLLSHSYAQHNRKLRWQCAAGHTWQATAGSVQSGNWCQQCYYDSMRSDISEMQRLASQKGGRCLSATYSTAHEHLEWQCAVGHTWFATPKTIYKSWCRTCAFDRKRLGLIKMQALAAQHSGRCLSETYVNSISQLTWQCDMGHTWLAKPMHILRGHWCIECHRIRIAKQREDGMSRKKSKFSVPMLL